MRHAGAMQLALQHSQIHVFLLSKAARAESSIRNEDVDFVTE
jgi:hypothetical protein